MAASIERTVCVDIDDFDTDDIIDYLIEDAHLLESEKIKLLNWVKSKFGFVEDADVDYINPNEFPVESLSDRYKYELFLKAKDLYTEAELEALLTRCK